MLIRLDSFDHYSSSQIEEKYTQLYGGSNNVNPTISPGTGRNGTHSLRCAATGVGHNVRPVALVVPAHETYILGYRLQTSGDGGWASNTGGGSFHPWAGLQSLNPRGHNWLAAFRADNISHITVVPAANGCLQFWKGMHVADEDRVRIATSDFALQWGRIYYLEWKITINSVTGRIVLKVNGDTWCDFTGNTAYEGTFHGLPPPQYIDEIVFGHLTNGVGAIGVTGEPIWDIDDLYIANADASNPKSPLVDFFGDHRIDWRGVTADGFHADWDPSTGVDHFAMVDDNPHDSDTTFNLSNSPGNRDSFILQDAILAALPIDAMQVIYSAKRIQGGPSSMRPFIRHDGNDFDGTARGNTTDYSFWMDTWEQITASGESPTPISTSVFNNLEVGYEKVT